MAMGLSLRDRSKSWLAAAGANRMSMTQDQETSHANPDREKGQALHVGFRDSAEGGSSADTSDPLLRPPRMHDRGLTIRMPQTSQADAFTAHHAQTPGWSSPWAPRLGDHRQGMDYWRTNGSGTEHDPRDSSASGLDAGTPWQRRRKLARAYLLNNVYVPLVNNSDICGEYLSHTQSSSSVSSTSLSPRLLLPSLFEYGSTRWYIIFAVS
jgi:hypothetical protein